MIKIRRLKALEDAAFALKSPGEISVPVKTNYGWHIIKLIRKVPLPPFEQVKNIFKNRVAADERSALGHHLFISRLKNVYNLKENPHYKNSEILNEQLNGSDKNLNGVLFTLNNEKILIPELGYYIRNHQSAVGAFDKSVTDWYRDFLYSKLIGLENSHLEKLYPDFKFLMNEYRNGILLFNYSERKIWDYSQTDTIGLKRFFESRSEVYRWKERAKASIYVAGSAELLAETKKMLRENNSGELIMQKLNESNPLNLIINQGVYERGEHMFVDRAVWKNNTDTEVILGNVHVLVQMHEVTPARSKTFDEVRGLVITDYQDFLEQEWVKELKQKYPVTINRKELKRLVR